MAEGKKLTRRVMMNIAKAIRNQEKVHREHRLLIGKAVAQVLYDENPLFDRATFLTILTGDLEYDPKTEKYNQGRGS